MLQRRFTAIKRTYRSHFRARSKTEMAHFLPQEIFDLIIDHLHDEPSALKACCLVSREWVQRARKHLFAHIEFDAFSRSVSRWSETFPDPANSPAHNARSLSIRYSTDLRAEDIETFPAFPNTIHLNVETKVPLGYRFRLVPLHRISTVIRSLRLVSNSLRDSGVFGLICSLPLLEDLTLISHVLRPPEEWTRPQTSPRLTGSLELYVDWGIDSVTHRLLDFPNGLHFKRIVVRVSYHQDVGSVSDLVSRCSDTLESLSIDYPFSRVSHSTSAPNRHLTLRVDSSPSIDLSRTTKLRDVEFLCVEPSIQWITNTLRTAESKQIRRISIGLFRGGLMRLSPQECSDLDPLLVHFWTSHSLRLKVMHDYTGSPEAALAWLLPQTMSVAVVDLVKYPRVPPPTTSISTAFW